MERDRQTDRQRQTDRETDTERDIDKGRDKDRDRETIFTFVWNGSSFVAFQTDRQTDRHISFECDVPRHCRRQHCREYFSCRLCRMHHEEIESNIQNRRIFRINN